MRMILLLACLTASCAKPEQPSPVVAGLYAGEGRDRLCVSGSAGAVRAGVIAYGAGDNNCSASGTIEGAGAALALVPRGEGGCRMPLTVEGDSLRVGQLPAACAYYCAPGASLSGKAFRRTPVGGRATDLAGDPLC